jgi:hypothetical protein
MAAGFERTAMYAREAYAAPVHQFIVPPHASHA